MYKCPKILKMSGKILEFSNTEQLLKLAWPGILIFEKF